jgi:RND family efflux transporter MFP subunit
VARDIPTDNLEDAGRSASTGAASYAFLDQALWKQFREAASPAEFARAWLALQCRFIDSAACGVVVLGEPEVGPFAPAACWPEQEAVGAELSAAAERAMAERRGVVLGPGEQSAAGDNSSVAWPLFVDERLYGVVAVSLTSARHNVRNVMRQLQWGAAWIEVLLRREQSRGDELQRDRTTTAFDMVAAVLEQERFQGACNAVVTELAMRLDCDPVSIGFLTRGRIVVKGISHAAQFGRRMNLIRDIATAMDEAVDQQAVVLYPAREDWKYRVTRAHTELAGAHQAGAILTIPLHSRGRVFGALTFERAPGKTFDEADVELCDAVASIIGPILDEKRQNDRNIFRKIGDSAWVQLRRLLGPRYFGRKLATAIAIAVVVFFALVTGDYRVTSPAVLEGRVQRTIVAPFDGYLATQHVRAGEIVQAGQLLATLDDRDLALERIRWSTERRQHLTEYDQALAKQERAESNIISTQIEQAEAQVALLDEQLSRTRIKAPFDGIIVSGDLSQSVGVALERGQELFKIAPLHQYRLILEVDESDIGNIQPGQEGRLRLASLPELSMAYVVERITPVAEQEEGRNYFRVESELNESSERLRPGMEGIAKTRVEDRLLIRIWTEKLVDWLRLTLWKWLP